MLVVQKDSQLEQLWELQLDPQWEQLLELQ